MTKEGSSANNRQMSSIFERFLTLWVGGCIVGGIILGKIAPDLAKTLDNMSISVSSTWKITYSGNQTNPDEGKNFWSKALNNQGEI